MDTSACVFKRYVLLTIFEETWIFSAIYYSVIILAYKDKLIKFKTVVY